MNYIYTDILPQDKEATFPIEMKIRSDRYIMCKSSDGEYGVYDTEEKTFKTVEEWLNG